MVDVIKAGERYFKKGATLNQSLLLRQVLAECGMNLLEARVLLLMIAVEGTVAKQNAIGES